jgi:MoaA/NifB/PqqE/SkfB family radical SAM enzyme
MKRVLVVHPPTSIARDFIDYPWFSDLGAVQAAAVLRARGDAVTLADAYALAGSTLAWRPDGRAHLGAPVDEVARACEAHLGSCDAVVVAYTPFHRPPARCDVLGATIAALRSRAPAGTRLILADLYQSGQHYVEADGDAVLASYPECDAWLKYEAEADLGGVVDGGLESGHADGPGRAALRGRDVPSLDTLPLPAWDLIDLSAHDAFRARVVRELGRGERAWAFPIDGRTLPLVTSRGCPFRCAHCSSNPGRDAGAPKTQRRLSAGRLREHVLALARDHGATRLHVLDEMVNVSARHFESLLDAVEEAGVRFDVPNGMRADYLERDHVRRMRGRVTTLSVSAESGVQRVLDDVVGKQLDVGAVTHAVEHAHAEGVPSMVHFIIGMPGESAEEVNATLAYAHDLHVRFGAWPAVQFATPLPGTRLAAGAGAGARALPVVEDWGPRFQVEPSQPDARVDAGTLRAFKSTFDALVRASGGPRKVVVNLTYACNNHCTFCAVGTRTQVHGNPERQREWLALYRARGVTLVDFDGGEPTLHPDLVALVRHAREIGYERVNVTTNGRMCFYETYARRLVRSGVTSLLFSVHGPDARTHAQQVGVAEAFDQTVGGIRNCVRLAPRGVELGMNVTVTKGNFERLPEIAELALSLGLPWLNIQFLTPFGRATRWVSPDTGDAARVAMHVIDAYRSRMKLQIINLPFCFMPGYEEFMVGDLAKVERHMVFVNNESVNLAAYLAERRTHKAECAPCPHRVFCGGFYELDDVPEPPWLVAPEDLVRPARVGDDVR